jgi:hypothetical protein
VVRDLLLLGTLEVQDSETVRRRSKPFCSVLRWKVGPRKWFSMVRARKCVRPGGYFHS